MNHLGSSGIPGMTVCVTNFDTTTDKADWWMGQVIWFEGGAKDLKVNTMFQFSDVYAGVIRWVNADQVTHVLPTS